MDNFAGIAVFVSYYYDDYGSDQPGARQTEFSVWQGVPVNFMSPTISSSSPTASYSFRASVRALMGAECVPGQEFRRQV